MVKKFGNIGNETFCSALFLSLRKMIHTYVVNWNLDTTPPKERPLTAQTLTLSSGPL